MLRPLTTEYYAYFQKYIDLVPEGDFGTLISRNTESALHFFHGIAEEKHNYCYAPGKWSIKDVLVHITDTERVMSYRALVAGRGDVHNVLGLMDENLYAAGVDNTGRSMESILAEFTAVRSATVHLLASLTEPQTLQISNVDGRHTTARAWGYIMLGHVQHHMNVVRERYL